MVAAEHARVVLVEVNDNMPRTRSARRLHQSRITASLHSLRPLAGSPLRPANDVEVRVAATVASLIGDGAVIQLGASALAEAIAKEFRSRRWDALAAVIAGAFKRYPRAHWTGIFQQMDACVSPVLSFGEAVRHPQITERGSLRAGPSGVVAAPAPRFAGAGQAGGAVRSTTAILAGVLANWQRDEGN